ncbi:MAG: SMP-30/gluconolactonase/LRE family protein, partial [Planctomycetaceae bacterium]
DLNIYGGDWWIANQAMERSLSFAGYEVRHAWGDGGHDNSHATEVFPEAMEWLWSGWPAAPMRGQGSPQLQEILLPGEEWRAVGDGHGAATALVADAAGGVSFVDSGSGAVWRVGPDGAAVAEPRGLSGPARATTPAGGTVAVGRDDAALVGRDGDSAPRALAHGWRGRDVVVDAVGRAYATAAPAEGSATGAVHIVHPDGRAARIDLEIRNPTGICLSPDQTLVYVADGDGRWVWSYSVDPDGQLSNGQRYYHLHQPDDAGAGAAGLAVDRDGRLWVATRMGLQICDQAGRVNAIVPVPSGSAEDICIGGPEGDLVHVAGGGRMYTRRVKPRAASPFLAPITPPKPRL